MKDENNLRTLYCHKEGSSVKTVVTESVGYFTFKLAACYATPDDEKSRVEVLKYHDDYVSDDKALGFRYSCHVQGNSYFYDPIGCILGGQFIEPGNIFQNGSLTVMCMRDGPQRLRLRPVYSSGNADEKACTETKTYIKDNFKYECTPGQQPKPTACIFFKNQKEVPIGATYNDDKAYQYKCEQTSDAKQLALVKTACLDNENQLLFEGGKKTLTDGSRIECQGNTDDGLLRVIVGGKPPIEQCKEGEALIQDYVLYRCKDNQFKPSACAPYNNETTTLMINVTIKVGNYEYKCEEQGKAIIYHAVACLDGDRNLLLPEEGCKHPAFEETIVCPNSIIDVSNGIKSVEYKSLFKCVLRDDKKYHLIEVGCKVDGKKYDIGDFVVQEKDVYKCVRSIDNEVHLIHVPSYQLTCRFENKVYQNGDEFKSLDGISHYQCIYGTLVKTGCFVHDKRIPANQLMYLNDEPYFCHGKGDGVIPIPFRK
uniref:Uncharacterized protein n=1 Tax=Panagrolaimus sp. PS1159 TaxID=55785 RepID=A0AC35FHU2_9BILA